MIELFSNCARSAFQHAKALLLPFRVGSWLKLAFLFAFTGASGNLGFNVPSPKNLSPTAFQAASPPPGATADASPTPVAAASPAPAVKAFDGIETAVRSAWQTNRALLTVIGLVALAVLIIFAILLTWLSSRLHFVLLRCLHHREVAIRANWPASRVKGFSFFKLNLVILVLMFAILAGGGLAGYAAYRNGLSGLPGATGLWIAFAILAFFVFLIAVFALLMVFQFLPIVMYTKDLLAIEALKRIGGFVRRNFWRALGLGALYFVLSIALSIGMAIAMVIVAIPLVLVGVLGWGLLALVPGGALVGAMLAAVLIVVAVLGIFLLSVPVSAFFAYLRIHLVTGKGELDFPDPA